MEVILDQKCESQFNFQQKVLEQVSNVELGNVKKNVEKISRYVKRQNVEKSVFDIKSENVTNVRNRRQFKAFNVMSHFGTYVMSKRPNYRTIFYFRHFDTISCTWSNGHKAE